MCPSYTKKSMDQLIIDYGTHLVTRPRFIHDFVILLGQNIDHGHVSIGLITGENIGLLP